MPSGRKPLPARLHRLHGNPHGHRLPEEGDEPRAPSTICSTPPPWFDRDQRAVWRHAVDHAPFGILAEIDRSTLAVWCVASVEHRRAALQIRQAGQVVEARDKRMIPNPHFRVLNACASLMIRAGSELGFSPASRASLGIRAQQRGGLNGNSKLRDYLAQKPDKILN
jgi:P27 family predicted phage terminase small subunit